MCSTFLEELAVCSTFLQEVAEENSYRSQKGRPARNCSNLCRTLHQDLHNVCNLCATHTVRNAHYNTMCTLYTLCIVDMHIQRFPNADPKYNNAMLRAM